MKKRIIFSVFLLLSIFLINQSVFAETEEENREKQVQDAGDSLKRENTHSETIESDDESEKEDKKEEEEATAQAAGVESEQRARVVGMGRK